MARYLVSSQPGKAVDTEEATHSWTQKGGAYSGRIKYATERLHRTANGAYWKEIMPRTDEKDFAWPMTNKAAAAWLLVNNHAIPDELKSLEDEVMQRTPAAPPMCPLASPPPKVVADAPPRFRVGQYVAHTGFTTQLRIIHLHQEIGHRPRYEVRSHQDNTRWANESDLGAW